MQADRRNEKAGVHQFRNSLKTYDTAEDGIIQRERRPEKSNDKVCDGRDVTASRQQKREGRGAPV